jgi:hypothetical protein
MADAACGRSSHSTVSAASSLSVDMKGGEQTDGVAALKRQDLAEAAISVVSYLESLQAE